jgi:hypothetical protein
MRTHLVPLIASVAIVSAIVCAPDAARADTITLASNNATIQPGGPRGGANGKNFFNIEGSSNGVFASFGVVDFQLASGTTFTLGDALSISLTQANASFTHNGLLAFYLTTDTTTSIEPTTSPLHYDVANLPTGLGSQLNTKFLLGVAPFMEVADGQTDTFSFIPTGAALSYLATINGGKLRLLIAPDDPTVAATYAGFSNAEFQGPAVSIVAEPSTLTLGTSGLMFALGYLRRRARFRNQSAADWRRARIARRCSVSS